MSLVQKITGALTSAKGGSALVAVLSLASAFGLQVSQAQQASILVFGGAVSAVLFTHGVTNAFKYLTPPTLSGLVAGGIGVAISFGAPITKAQSESVLELTALIAGLLITNGIVHTVARDRREPAPAKAPELTAVLGQIAQTVDPHTASLHADVQQLVDHVKALVSTIEGDVKRGETAVAGTVRKGRAKAAARVAGKPSTPPAA